MIIDKAKQDLNLLIEKYTINRQAQLDDMRVMNDFVMPFLKIFGWSKSGNYCIEDIDNKYGVPYKASISGETCFYLAPSMHGTRSQIMNFAYNSNVPWAILTSFESLQLYNTLANGKPILELTSQEYIEKYRLLEKALRPESFLLGDVDEILELKKRHEKLKIKLPIDRLLVERINLWRQRLLNSFPNEKAEAVPAERDFLVHQFLNRLIFIRSCEDRGIEPLVLKPLAEENSANLAERIVDLFQAFSKSYDTELFTHISESPLFADDAIRNVVLALYGDHELGVTYDFGVIEEDVLGMMYEQYLGQNYQGHRAWSASQSLLFDNQLGAFSSARRSRGIYYTPTAIVDYIVQTTLAQYAEQSPLNSIEDCPKVLDLACGSGAFLAKALDSIIERMDANGADAGGQREIGKALLSSYMFGVDIDVKAVEATRLNLWLRALCDRSLLPALRQNIIAGDALLATSAIADGGYIDEYLRQYQESDASDVVRDNAYDIVIGNPPYIGYDQLKRDPYQNENLASYLKLYETAQGKFDLSSLFLERAIRCAKDNGLIGLIIPNRFMRSDAGRVVREFIDRHADILSTVDFIDQKVFKGIKAYTCILVLRKTTEPQSPVVQVGKVKKLNKYPGIQLRQMTASVKQMGAAMEVYEADRPKQGAPWILIPKSQERLLDKTRSSARLHKFAQVFEGVKTGSESIYVFDHVIKDLHEHIICFSHRKNAQVKIEKKILRRAIRGTDIKRYRQPSKQRYVIYPYDGNTLISEERLASEYPFAYQYLLEFREQLLKRTDIKQNSPWYMLSRSRDTNQLNKPKLLAPKMATGPQFIADVEGEIFNLDSAMAIVPNSDDPEIAWGLLGLLNSKLLGWFIGSTSQHYSDGFLSFATKYLEDVPIPDRLQDDAILKSELARKVQSLSNFYAFSDPVFERAEIKDLETSIDNLIYIAFGLSRSEIDIINESFRRSLEKEVLDFGLF